MKIILFNFIFYIEMFEILSKFHLLFKIKLTFSKGKE